MRQLCIRIIPDPNNIRLSELDFYKITWVSLLNYVAIAESITPVTTLVSLSERTFPRDIPISSSSTASTIEFVVREHDTQGQGGEGDGDNSVMLMICAHKRASTYALPR